ncbi:MAG: PAS domain-containing protein [Alphaproteobacteria bacterium]|nr:PAS domain-containing protein [Alphaproteobacteria bacterium]
MRELGTESALLRRVWAVWRGLPRRGDLPRRADFSPTLLAPEDLRYILLVEVIDGGRDFAYRLVGTGVVQAVGKEFTGLKLSEHLDEHEVPELFADYRRAVQQRTPTLFQGGMLRFDKDWMAYERLSLPLVDDGGRVSVLLGAADFGPIDPPAGGRPLG